MGESLMERRRVGDEGLRIVNPCHLGAKLFDLIALIVDSTLEEEAVANSVPAAAVIQRLQALFGFTGRKGCAGGQESRM